MLIISLGVLICLNQESQSRHNQEIKIFGLDSMDNLDKFQNFVSILRTIFILISIGLDCRDPQA